MSSPYVLSPNTIIHDDLKIFMGTCNEIYEIEQAGRVVNRKWYLAWDTGEIYIGNGKKKLIRFGGSANNLSQKDIEDIISSYTASDLKLIKMQLSNALKQYNDSNTRVNNLSTKIDNAIEELNTNTIAYIEEKIDEVLASAEGLTYSKAQIDALLDSNYEKVNENFISNDELTGALSNYMTSTEINNSRLGYASGNNLLSYLTNRVYGYYFCITDSSDINFTFEKGHIYFLNNGSYEDIAAMGGGGSTGSAIPQISLLLDGVSSKTLTIGDNFVKDNVHVTFTITNKKYMVGTLNFYENQVAVKSDISVNATDFYFNSTLQNLTRGKYNYTLVGTDKNKNTIVGTFTLNVIAPIFYGSGSNIIPQGETIKSTFNKKMSDSVAGEYTFTVNQNEYAWIFVPSGLSINKITLNGFTAPFNEPEDVQITFGNVTQNYKGYRSYSSLQNSTITLKIE